MSTDAIYINQRANLLARLVLTRRKGILVFPFPEDSDKRPPRAEGTDFIAIFQKANIVGAHLFARVKGTNEVLKDEQAAFAYCSEDWKLMYAEPSLFAPTVFLLFSVEGDQGFFSWVLEPQVDREKGSTLTQVESPVMRKINRKSMEELFDRVEEWYKAMASEHLLRGKSSA
jgi:hypothetical protein